MDLPSFMTNANQLTSVLLAFGTAQAVVLKTKSAFCMDMHSNVIVWKGSSEKARALLMLMSAQLVIIFVTTTLNVPTQMEVLNAAVSKASLGMGQNAKTSTSAMFRVTVIPMLNV